MSHPALYAQGLVMRFGGLLATDHADLSVREGEIHALIGPNGAGKTTLINLLSGALRPQAGRITLAGHDVTALPLHRRARAGLVRSYQITSVFPKLSVRDNLALAVLGRLQTGSGVWSFWRPAAGDAQRQTEAAECAARVGLAQRLHTPAGALSHGEQRQLELGLALALRPRVLLLDEPMAGMGPEESQRMVALLQGLRGQTTVLLVEHDMDAVFRLADRVSVLVAGRVLASGEPEAIRRDPAVIRAYLGEDSAA